MTTHRVTRVRKASPELDPSHEHLVGVLTEDGTYHTVEEVAERIRAGEAWLASAPGEPDAPIWVEDCCPKGWCMHRPYLSSAGGDTLATDLERMPRG